MKPRRIQLSRAKGWCMPPDTVKVDRSTRWGNRFRAGTPVVRNDDGTIFARLTAKGATEMFRDSIQAMPVQERAEFLASLRGRNLACWCPPDQPCHADVLLELANS